MVPEEQEKARKLIEAELKFRAYVSIGWGLLILFAMMGVIMGKPLGIYVGIIGSVIWVMNRIIRETFDSLRLLRALKVSESKGDDEPRPPTT